MVSNFKRDNERTDDAPRSGSPKSATTDHQIGTIHRLVMNDRRVTVLHTADTMGIRIDSVHAALTYILGMSKLSARRVPRMLTPDQKLKRPDISRTHLIRFQTDPANFFKSFVTQNETWVNHFHPESKPQSKQWKHSGSPPPKKFKRVASVGKVMASFF